MSFSFLRKVRPAGLTFSDIADQIRQASIERAAEILDPRTIAEQNARADLADLQRMTTPAIPVSRPVNPAPYDRWLDPDRVAQRLGEDTQSPIFNVSKQDMPLTYARFIEQCPTREEIQQILDDIDIEFQPGSGAENLVKKRKFVGSISPAGATGFNPALLGAQVGDAASPRPPRADCDVMDDRGLTTLAATVKIFQLLKWIPFDSPIPLMGNPYNWIKNARSFFTGTKFRIFRDKAALTTASAFYVDLVLYDVMDAFTVIDLAASVCHEMRHTMPGGGKIHTCNSAFTSSVKGSSGDLGNLGQFWRNDQGYIGNGACAYQYWFLVWCRHHAPSIVWPGNITTLLDAQIDFIWKTYFCYEFGKYDFRKIGPPTGPRQVYGPGVTYLNDKGKDVPWIAPGGDPLFRSEDSQTITPPTLTAPPTYGVPMVPYGLNAWWLYPETRDAVAAQWGTTWQAMRGPVLTL